MVGHTHKDIHQILSVISKHLKQLHVNCPDFQSFVEEVRKAVSDPKEIPDVIFLVAPAIFDYVSLYEAYIDSHISYHQESHVFWMKKFVT